MGVDEIYRVPDSGVRDLLEHARGALLQQANTGDETGLNSIILEEVEAWLRYGSLLICNLFNLTLRHIQPAFVVVIIHFWLKPLSCSPAPGIFYSLPPAFP